ncbi:hypothetical protein MUA03_12305 [Enterobacteriaceae bacterium H16N7]|nr:hypothetical protein [Dryocola clanedunensis]
MSDTEKKTKKEYVGDVVSQLKEIRHYAETNTERLSAHWLAFDTGEYADKAFAGKVSELLNMQGKLHDELESLLQDMEIFINQDD